MTTIKVNSKCKYYKKCDSAMRKSICVLLKRLLLKIESTGCSDINGIFNDPTITYDRLNSELFIFKSHGLDNTQIRIVYGYKSGGDGETLYLVDITNKKANNKEYIKEMNAKFKNVKLSDMSFEEIKCLEDVEKSGVECA